MFSTTKKKLEVAEKYDVPVLTQYALTKEGERSASVFGLNKAAMEAFGFQMNTPLVNKIANGYDEENNLVLAATDTNDAYTSNITAKNTFSSKKLLNRIIKDYNINPEEEHEFLIMVDKLDGEPAIGLLALISNELWDINNGVAADTTAVKTESFEHTGYIAEAEPAIASNGEGGTYTPDPVAFEQKNATSPHVVSVGEF